MLSDMHTHLSRFDPGTVAGLVQRAREAGVACVVTVGMSLPDSELALQVAEQYDIVWAAVGFHPWRADEIEEAHFDRLRQLTRHARAVAVGEVGLDSAKEPRPSWEKQVANFRRQIRLAREVGLSLNIHVKGQEAEQLLIAILREERASQVGGLLHGFTGSLETARAAMDLGFFISTPRQLLMAEGERYRQLFTQIPLAATLLDTDASPSAAPLPDGRHFEPALVRDMALQVAALHETTLEAVSEYTERNRRQVLQRR